MTPPHSMQRLCTAFPVVLLFVAGCSMAPQLAESEAVSTLPDRFEQAAAGDAASQRGWWHAFGSKGLDVLVDSVLVRNLDLRLAVARVAEMHGLYRISRAVQLPSVQVGAERNEQSTPSNTGIGGALRGNAPPGEPLTFPDRFEFTTFSASLGISYELDFWGRVRGSKRAALRDVLASEADVRAALIGVISETIAVWFEIVERQRTLALTRENVDLLRERLSLTAERYERGLLTSYELYGIRQQFEEARAGVPVLESQLEDARGRLGLLLGRHDVPHATDPFAAGGATFVPRPIPAGLPSDLLEERPDVVAAFQRLEAARERVGIARAARFPRFALTGAGGLQSGTLSDIARTDQNFWTLGTGLAAPVFGAGALRALERAAWARYEQQALLYEKTVLGAFREVETALATYAKQRERHTFLAASVETARDNAMAQERRFRRGVGDYVALLDARRNRVRAEMAEAASLRALAAARLAVHRALGGAWMDRDS